MNQHAITTQTFTATRCEFLEHAITFQRERLVPDVTKGYVEFSLAHAFPVVTAYQSAFHPGTVQHSYGSMRHQVLDLRHQVASYFKDSDHPVREDRIIGSVLGVEFPMAPAGGWALTDADRSPGIRGVAVLHKQAKGVDRVLGEHQGGRHQWTVSLEVDYRLSESAVLLVPTDGARELDTIAFQTPALYARAGLHCLAFLDAPDDLLACYDDERGMFTRMYRGWKPITLLGGVDGEVHFKGVGLVEYGAEPTARVEQMLAEEPQWAAFARGLETIATGLERF